MRAVVPATGRPKPFPEAPRRARLAAMSEPTQAQTVNVLGDDWDATSDQPGFRKRSLGVGRRLAGEMLGA